MLKLEGKGCLIHPKRMNFRISSEGGGGSISIQKFILQVFAIIDDTSVMNFGKILQYDFPKMRGRGFKGRLELFRKFIRLGCVRHPEGWSILD